MSVTKDITKRQNKSENNHEQCDKGQGKTKRERA